MGTLLNVRLWWPRRGALVQTPPASAAPQGNSPWAPDALQRGSFHPHTLDAAHSVPALHVVSRALAVGETWSLPGGAPTNVWGRRVSSNQGDDFNGGDYLRGFGVQTLALPPTAYKALVSASEPHLAHI